MADFLQQFFEFEVFAEFTGTASASFTLELKVSYRLGTTFNDDKTSTNWCTQFTGQGDNRVTSPKAPETTTADLEFLVGTDGALVSSPSVPSLPSENIGLLEQPIADVYYRIWCIPPFLRVQNPALNTDIPFTVWQAYTVQNNLTSIGGSGQTGLTLDIAPVELFEPVEDRIVNLQVTPSAPNQVFAIYLFNFDQGQGVFTFETTLLDWIRFIPDQPVLETWNWITDIITAYDGSSEQRMSARRQPRRRIEASLLLEDDIERQREYDRWYSRIGRDVVIPFYQYSARLTADAAISATKIFFNPALTDFRDGDLAVIFRETTEESFIVETSTIDVDGANLAAPLTVELKKNDIVAPGFVSRLDNKTGPTMQTVAGRIQIAAEVEDFRPTFNRPGSAAVIDTFDSLNVLDRCPIVRGDVAETFDQKPTIYDGQTGIHDQATHWLHPFIDGLRSFNVKRLTDPTEMDYFRDFLTQARGMREPFLMPTWREDLFLASIPTAGSPNFLVDSLNYSSQYFPYDTYKRLRLVNPDGDSIYRKVTAVADQPGGTTLLTLDTPLPNVPAWGNGFEIQYLNRVRLASDQIRLTHFTMNTIIEFAVRTTDT